MTRKTNIKKIATIDMVVRLYLSGVEEIQAKYMSLLFSSSRAYLKEEGFVHKGTGAMFLSLKDGVGNYRREQDLFSKKSKSAEELREKIAKKYHSLNQQFGLYGEDIEIEFQMLNSSVERYHYLEKLYSIFTQDETFAKNQKDWIILVQPQYVPEKLDLKKSNVESILKRFQVDINSNEYQNSVIKSYCDVIYKCLMLIYNTSNLNATADAIVEIRKMLWKLKERISRISEENQNVLIFGNMKKYCNIKKVNMLQRSDISELEMVINRAIDEGTV